MKLCRHFNRPDVERGSGPSRRSVQTLALLLLPGALAACQTGVSMGPGGTGPAELGEGQADGGVARVAEDASPGEVVSPLASREVFLAEVEAPLVAECGACHVDETPAFMAGPDLYDAVMAWPDLVTPGVPAASSILTTGVHTGPAFTPGSVTTVFRWIIGADANAPGEPVGDAGPPLGVGEGLPGAPTALFEAAQEDNERRTWRFDARGSTATEGVIAEYLWRWGDGTTGTGPDVVHTFPAEDTYAVQLTVVDDQSRRASTTQVLALGEGGGYRVVGFTLLDENNNEVGPLRNGDDIDLADTPQFTIRADTAPVVVGSVRFAVDVDPNVRIENAEPYDLASGDLNLVPGVYRISAQAYSEDNGNGIPGGSFTVSISLR